MTAKEINELANKYLDNKNHFLIVVGNKYALKDKLSKFGKVVEMKIK